MYLECRFEKIVLFTVEAQIKNSIEKRKSNYKKEFLSKCTLIIIDECFPVIYFPSFFKGNLLKEVAKFKNYLNLTFFAIDS